MILLSYWYGHFWNIEIFCLFFYLIYAWDQPSFILLNQLLTNYTIMNEPRIVVNLIRTLTVLPPHTMALNISPVEQ